MRLTIPPRFLALAGLISPFCQYTFTLLSPKGDKIHKFHSKNETKTAKKIMFSWSEMAGFTAPRTQPPSRKDPRFLPRRTKSKSTAAKVPPSGPLFRFLPFWTAGPVEKAGRCCSHAPTPARVK